MYGLLVLSAVILTTALLPIHGKPVVISRAGESRGSQVARNATPLLYDRLSNTKRLLERLAQRPSTVRAARPTVIAPIAAYRTIRRVDFLAPGAVVNSGNDEPNGYVSGINNRGQISYTPTLGEFSPSPYVIGPAYIIDDDGTHVMLSESILTPLEKPGLNIAFVQANALNDVGGVAGIYDYLFFRPDGSSGGFSGNLGWSLQSGAYPISYFDGYDAGAQAYAINNNSVAAGISGGTDPKHVSQAAVFSKAAARRFLLPLQNPACANPQFESSQATGINDAGEVVGYVQTGSRGAAPCDSLQAVRFNMSGYAEPLLPSQPPSSGVNFYQSVAEAINQRGDIVGYAGAGQIKAFLYKAACNCVTFLPRPSGENLGSAEAYAVNASDDVVGAYIEYDGTFSTAFLATRGRTYDLNSLLPPNSGWTISTAIGINDAREIIGFGTYQDPITKQAIPAAFAMKP